MASEPTQNKLDVWQTEPWVVATGELSVLVRGIRGGWLDPRLAILPESRWASGETAPAAGGPSLRLNAEETFDANACGTLPRDGWHRGHRV